MTLTMTATVEQWRLKNPFRISGRVLDDSGIVCVALSDGTHTGHGEGWAFDRFGQSIDGALAELAAVKDRVEQGLTREELLEALPAGTARNALDCAMWDLEAKQQGCRVWDIAGLDAPAELITATTLGLDTPENMAAAAASQSGCPLFKIKLGEEGDLERLQAIRAAVPAARLVVDVNEGWTLEQLKANLPALQAVGVEMIEQPLPAADDHQLAGLESPIPISADESCHSSDDVDRLAGLYQMVTIKLDKTGGLTEALRLADKAKAAGLDLMIGCMLGTSRAMAAGYVVGSMCKVVDLDAPLVLASDRPHAMLNDNGHLHSFSAALWG